MQQLQHAEFIALMAHRHQRDAYGDPYSGHLRRVVSMVDGDEARAVAWLHDLVEKVPGWSLLELRREGFGESVTSGVEAMTRAEDEDYLDSVRRASRHPVARQVKRADLADHVARGREHGLDTSRYEAGLRVLDEADARLAAERAAQQQAVSPSPPPASPPPD